MKKFFINEVDFSKYDLVIFDLDDTLYSEKDYLFQVYQEIAEYIESNYKILKEESFHFLKEYFLIKGRKKLFDEFIKEKQIGSSEIDDFLHIMRTISLPNKLSLYPLMKEKLKEVIGKTKVCVVTNGNPIQQRNKVAQINWENIEIRNIYYANEVVPKPSVAVFEIIKKDFLFKGNDKILMIGDSQVDEEFAKNIGADFVKIKL